MNDNLAKLYGYLRAIWRKRWLAVTIAWATCAALWLAILLLPDRYEATARVFVDSRTPLRPVLEGIAIEDNTDSQLALVREALLSRPQLESVVKETGLIEPGSSQRAIDDLVGALQQQIRVAGVSAAGQEGPVRDTIYSIAYEHPERAKSVEVVQTLLDNFVEGTLAGNRSGSTEAQGFLVAQISDIEKRLTTAEARLADFKKRNVGMLPGERGDYFSRLEREMTGLKESETSLATAISRREELLRQLASARKYVPGTSVSASPSLAGSVTPDVSLRVQEAEARLEELLLRFTEKHPEVIALRKNIAELKAREAEELALLARGGAGTGAIRSLQVNPVYQQMQVQLAAVEVEIASLRGAAVQHRREIDALQRFVDLAPEVEQEYARLNRDYDVVKAQYETLVARLEQAKVTDEAARSGIVRFDVIDPPRADSRPTWPNRPILMLLGLLAGLGAGLLAAVVPQILAPTFVDPTTLAKDTGRPVIGTVSILRRAADPIFSKREQLRVAGAFGALVFVCFVLVAFGEAGRQAIKGLLA